MKKLIWIVFLFSCSENRADKENNKPESSKEYFFETGKIKLRFTSNRTFFDQKRGDTILIMIENLPLEKRSIDVSGALISHIQGDSFIIKTSKYYPDLTEIKFRIDENDPSSGNKKFYDSINIPAK